MGALIRAHDWSDSPLGAPATWPQSLKSVVELVLGSKLPMFVAWGDQLGFLYNDAYAQILGAKHPAALGARFQDVWSEIWSDIAPLIALAMAGDATYRDDLPLVMNRNGADEQTWFTFSYSPVRDERGDVAGMFCACTETTGKVLAERRLAAQVERQRRQFEQTPGFVCISHGPHHIYEFVNPAYARLCGARDYIGKTVREVLPDIEEQGFFEPLDGVYATGERFVAENVAVRLERTPGAGLEERFVDFVYEPIIDETGEVTGIFTQGHDVTEARNAQEARRTDTEFLRSVLAASNDCIKVLDLDTNLTFMSEGGRRVMEVSDFNAIEGCPWPDFWEGQGNIDAIAATEAAKAGGTGRFQGFAKTMAGTPKWWDVQVTSIKGPDGQPEQLLCVSRDVTEHKQAADTLRETESRFRNMADHTPMMMWVTDASGYCTYLNRRWYEFTGQSESEAEGFGWLDATHPDDKDEAGRIFLDANAQQQPFRAEYRLRRADGAYRWAIDAASPRFGADGTYLGYIGSVVDIDDRKQAEEALRQGEEKYHSLFDMIDAGFCIIEMKFDDNDDPVDYKIIEANPAFVKQTGLEGALGKWVSETAPDLERYWHETYGRVALTGETARFENQAMALSERWFDVLAYRVGEPGAYRVAILFTDISERKRAEQAIAQLNETLEQRVADRTAERDEVWRNSHDLMVVTRYDGTVLANNPAWTAVLGWSDAELVGKNLADLVHPDDVDKSLVEAERLSADGRATMNFENRYRSKDGGWVWLSWAVSSNEGRLYAVARNVTNDKARQVELELAQDSLRQSQKLEAMGQLTGGVAHDFNNLLTPIVGSLDMLQRRKVGDERERRLIDGAAQSAERAKTLVQRLLAFARRQPLTPSAIDLGALIEGMAGLVSSTSGPQIKVLVKRPDNLQPAFADPNQLELAILNLAVNARDAMPEGGTLTLAVDNDAVGPTHRSGLPAGEYVRLSVADTGMGMSEATLARAIEPFFSTKGIGKGTGLGLSMVHGLALQLGGAMALSSEPGLGTKVDLWLPVSTVAAKPPAPDPGQESSVGIGAVVLLVDDEPAVRASTADMLEDLGYVVVEADSAAAALKLLDDGLVPDLLLTDHLMPGMTGADLAHEVRGRWPDRPILLITGFAEVDDIAPDLPRLTKPFRQAELSAMLIELTA